MKMHVFRKLQRVKKYSYLVRCGIFLPLLFSCAQQTLQLAPIPLDDQGISQDYQIGPEDVVEVMVWKNADLSRVVNVRPDGKISLPLIGDIQAAGYTALQLKDEITEQLNTYYKESPQVSVIVQQINSYAIYILGEVRRPGKYTVKTGTTFLQAISLAGGFTEFASTNRILLKRKVDENNSESSMNIKYKAIISGVQRNIVLKSGDTIIIP
jgi:polysaccharide export outer membrane protein